MPPKGSTKCKDCNGKGIIGGDVEGEADDIPCPCCHGKGYAIDGECEHSSPEPGITSGGLQTMIQETVTTLSASDAVRSDDSAPKAVGPVEIRGWGWWSAYDKQMQWLAEVEAHILFPSEQYTKGISEAPPSIIASRLEDAGGALTYLHAQQGLLEGRSHALKEVFENGMNAAKGRIPASAKLTSEAAKESWVYANMPDIGEALRETKRRHIEIETCVKSQAGLIRAYTAAWETISRVLTATLGELSLATGRGN